METVKPALSVAVQRLHVAHRVQRRYPISSDDMAVLLGLTVEAYHKRLKKAGFDSAASNLPALDIEDILVKINAELHSFSKGEGLPDKSAVDALAALAKAVKSISELSKETRNDSVADENESQSENGGVKPEDVREALSLINRRINELSGQTTKDDPATV